MGVRHWFVSAGIALACVACAPHGGGSPAPAPAPSAAQAPVPAPDRLATATTPDASCRVASDCAVKNVGNCCGYFPACVNKDASVDPAAVRAECARSGMASVCGFREIQACECVQNQCRAVDGPIAVDR